MSDRENQLERVLRELSNSFTNMAEGEYRRSEEYSRHINTIMSAEQARGRAQAYLTASDIVREALADDAAGEDDSNQCDGCARGLSVRDGMHETQDGMPVMICTSDRYTTPPQHRDALEALDEIERERMTVFDGHEEVAGTPEEAKPLFALVRRALTNPAVPTVPQHPDDAAVDRFADAMKEKLARARDKGRGGWDDPGQCSDSYLAKLLVDHLRKGNAGTFEDVANFAMMLHQRGAIPTTLAEAANYWAEPAPPTVPEGLWCADITSPGYDGYINLLWGEDAIPVGMVPPPYSTQIKSALAQHSEPGRDYGQCPTCERPLETRLCPDCDVKIKRLKEINSDLLEALDLLFDLSNHFNVSGVYFTEDSENREALEQAEAAIAKAKGET